MNTISDENVDTGQRVAFRQYGGKVTRPNKLVRGSDKRTIADREHDLVFVAKWYLAGVTQQEIAERLSEQRDYSISRAQIAKDVKLLFVRWQDSYLIDFDVLKAKELAKIDRLENEYWTAWERSLAGLESEEEQTVDDAYKDLGTERLSVDEKRTIEEEKRRNKINRTYERRKTVRKTEKSLGNPEFLKGVERCIDQRCKILGLVVQKSISVTWRQEARKAGFNPDNIVDGMVENFLDVASRPVLESGDENEIGEIE